MIKSSKLSDKTKKHFYDFNNVLDFKNLLKHFLLILLSNVQRNVRYLIYCIDVLIEIFVLAQRKKNYHDIN